MALDLWALPPVPSAARRGHTGVPRQRSRLPGLGHGAPDLAQASQGVEVTLPADITLTATGFLSEWSGLTDLDVDCVQIMPATLPPQSPNSPGPQMPPYTCPSNQPTHGIAYGLEVLLRRSFAKRLSGWLSYTLSRSTRDEHFLTPTGGDVTATVAADYDRTHVLNAVLAYDFGRRWKAGARFVFMTGTPYSNLTGNVPVAPYNGLRDPPFYRVDVRLEKRWLLGKKRYVAFIFEVQNVTLSKETVPFGTDCQSSSTSQGGTTQCTQPTIGPLTVPSIGVEGGF